MASANEAVAGRKTPEKKPTNSLYEYNKVYPRYIKGKFRNLKWLANAILLAIFFLAPFLRWDRGAGAPDQAILIDMEGRRAYFFMIEIWPQEVYYLTGILIMAAVGLFFVTSLLGRVWCGFTCWQTVFSDIFIWVEEQFEGDRNKRMRMDQGPMTAEKFLRKAGKHMVFALMGLLTGLTLTLYFDDAFVQLQQVFTLEASTTVYTFLALFGFLTYLLAGWAREQVCIYMCPWPRFQAAMVDDDSLIVTYESWRGEPRGPVKGTEVREKGAAAFDDRGHCVDCKMCVQVCPAGIDIRNGSQLACIGCALCIDACNSIMDRFGLPRGLITYDSLNRQVAREKGAPVKKRLVRPRTIAYATLMAAVGVAMLFLLSTRATTEINVLHERSPLYVTMSDGSIRNAYTYKILNMIREDREYTLSLEGMKDATLTVIGIAEEPVSSVDLVVKPDNVGTFRVYVSAPKSSLEGKRTDITFVVKEKKTGQVLRNDSLFAGPDN